MFQSSGRWAFGIPLPEVVAEGEDALLGAGALLVAAGAAERGLEAVLLDRVEQGDGLEPVARGARTRLLHHAAVVDRLLHGGHDQVGADLLHDPVAVLDDLREVLARVHVHDRERKPGRARRPCGPGAAARPSPCRRRRAARRARARRPPRASRGSPPPPARGDARSRSSCRPHPRDGRIRGLPARSRVLIRGARTPSSPARPSGRCGRCREACRERSRSSRSRGREAGGRGGRARARSARRRPRSSPPAG